MKVTLSLVLAVSTFLTPVCAWSQDATALRADIDALTAEIAAAEKNKAGYGTGIISNVVSSRIEMLRLSQSALQARLDGLGGGEVRIVEIPAVEPNPELADKILNEIIAQEKHIAGLESESKSGGLIGNLNAATIETEKMNLAMLRGAWFRASYGVISPAIADMPVPSASVAAGSSGVSSDSESASATERPEYADPRFPEIDYSASVWKELIGDGYQISGWFAFNESSAAIDDTPSVHGINVEKYATQKGFSAFTKALHVRCSEGEAAVIFNADSYVINDYRSNTLKVTYRIDDQDAVTGRWSSLTSNQGGGLFGGEGEALIRKLKGAKKLFLRLEDNNGQRHDAEFPMQGSDRVFSAVATACGFSLIELTVEDYRAIQTLLNAAGFSTGTPDGKWGPGSKKALQAFQESVGLPGSGSPDEATLEKLGFSL